jgi:hypothetical protein
VQAVGRVGRELLKAAHRSDLGRDADQVAAVRHEVLHGGELGDARGQRDVLTVLLGAEFDERLEFLAAVFGGLVHVFEQAQPARSGGVLDFAVEMQHAPRPAARAVSRNAGAEVLRRRVGAGAGGVGPPIREYPRLCVVGHAAAVFRGLPRRVAVPIGPPASRWRGYSAISRQEAGAGRSG